MAATVIAGAFAFAELTSAMATTGAHAPMEGTHTDGDVETSDLVGSIG